MADEKKPKPEAAAKPASEQAAPQPIMKCQRQYIRDLSFENLAVQKNITMKNQPNISVQVNIDARNAGESLYEITQKMTVSALVDTTTIFLLELDYGGVFLVQNVADEQLHPFLMIECPRMLFPFMRRIVHDVTSDGGYPPLNIDNIDYLALYRAELQKRAAESKTEN